MTGQSEGLGLHVCGVCGAHRHLQLSRGTQVGFQEEVAPEG